jgi:FkbM family methyltransferase
MKQYGKAKIQALLRQVGLYYRLKGSSLYTFYWLMADRRIVDRNRREQRFYRNLLPVYKPGDLIIDIGANQGAKTGVFLRLGARVVAVDPDAHNQQILNETFLKYRFRRKPLLIVPSAVSDKRGVATFWMQRPGSAMNTLSRKWVDTLRSDRSRFDSEFRFSLNREIDTLTLQDLIAAYGEPAFVKIDVEGHELHVIRGLQRPVACLSFEVNLPEFRTEGKQCINELSRLAADGTFNYAVDCERGLELAEWCSAAEFRDVLERCQDKSIEVFWRTTRNATPVERTVRK